VKPKLSIALLLILLGTNLFAFTTARQRTTEDVLKNARQRIDAVLTKYGIYEQIYLADRDRGAAFVVAISDAGGMYYGWNEALMNWGLAGLLIITGILVPLIRPRSKSPA